MFGVSRTSERVAVVKLPLTSCRGPGCTVDTPVDVARDLQTGGRPSPRDEPELRAGYVELRGVHVDAVPIAQPSRIHGPAGRDITAASPLLVPAWA